MTPALRKKCHLGHFTNLHISHPAEQIFTFQVWCGQLLLLFIIFKDFPESRKKVFHDHRPVRKISFWAFHIFTNFSPK